MKLLKTTFNTLSKVLMKLKLAVPTVSRPVLFSLHFLMYHFHA